MKALQLTPVIRACGPRDAQRPHPLTIDEAGQSDATWQLACHTDGSLIANGPNATAEDANTGDVGNGDKPNHAERGEGQARLLGWLRLRNESGKSSWFFVPATQQCGINGTTPPFPVVLLRPGMLLSFGDEFWVVSSLWAPEPIDAPPELADKNCPVCGLELGCAQVVACLCGNYMHLEKPGEPDDPDALNCYLTKANCGACQRPTSLDPQVVPEISDALLTAETEDEDEFFGDDFSQVDACPDPDQLASEPTR